MVAPAGGKTAPRLLDDLLTYDARFEGLAGRNLLTTLPPFYDEGALARPAVPSRNCRHALMVKHEQSHVPEGDGPAPGNAYKIATLCQTCRWHFDLVLDLRNGLDTPCNLKSGDFKLHHFALEDERIEDADLGGNPGPRTFLFKCTAPCCPLRLTVAMRPPQFSPQQIVLLTDRIHLRTRWETAKSQNPDRTDGQIARPVDTLDHLRSYIKDCLYPTKGKVRIPFQNRKYLKAFGRDCDQIFKQLGFSYANEPQEGDEPSVECWYPPAPPAPGNLLGPITERTALEDSEHELECLLLAYPEAERHGLRNTVIRPQSATSIIQSALACQDYPKRPLSGTRASQEGTEDHPHYVALGALADFSDDLLMFSFYCQLRQDLKNNAYYFECLKEIAIGRDSDHLSTQVMLLQSQGQVGQRTLDSAYKQIGMVPSQAAQDSDDTIIGQFRSRLQDISPAACEQAREALMTIGHARNSDLIKQAASNVVETYEQALAYLGAEAATADEFVVSLCTLRMDSVSESDRKTAREAVKIIAKHRNSPQLNLWLDEGQVVPSSAMDVSEAYALLGIEGREIADFLTMVKQTADAYSDDNPMNRHKYEEAYAVICKDEQSRLAPQSAFMHQLPQLFQQQRRNCPLDSWPVGCRNMGNTCYLNSVLQFLFTIKPLRDQVLDCDGHLQEATPEALAAKTVGRSRVTVEKVKKAQEFVYELRRLFDEMIHANTDCVRPSLRLASLALTKTDPNEDMPKPISDNANKAGLGAIEGRPVAGPQPKPEVPKQSDDIENAGNDEGYITGRNSLSENPSSMDIDTPMMDAFMDTPMSGDTNETGHKDELPVAHTNGTVENDELPDVETDENAKISELPVADTTANKKPELPSRPPPVPPRPLDTRHFDDGVTSQQDSAEILNNIFDLLSCAFEGDGVMQDGEQKDFVKGLFFSDVITEIDKNGVISRSSALKDHTLVSAGQRERPLCAALDDEFMKKEVEAGEASIKAYHRDFIGSAAPIQIINVRRLIFDNKGGQITKDYSHLHLDEVLYLDRYLRATKSLSEQQMDQLREKQWGLQSRLNVLVSRQKALYNPELEMSLPEAVEETANMLEDMNEKHNENLIDVDSNPIPAYAHLPTELKDRAQEVRKEAETLDGQMKELDQQINAIFKDCKDHPYRLHAVFIHRGTTTGGHYWIYIYDSQKKLWRKYNDEYVEEIDIRMVLEKQGTDTSTGIVYVQDDRVDEITEAVHRRPQQSHDVADTEMKDAPLIIGVDPQDDPVQDIILSKSNSPVPEQLALSPPQNSA